MYLQLILDDLVMQGTISSAGPSQCLKDFIEMVLWSSSYRAVTCPCHFHRTQNLMTISFQKKSKWRLTCVYIIHLNKYICRYTCWIHEKHFKYKYLNEIMVTVLFAGKFCQPIWLVELQCGPAQWNSVLGTTDQCLMQRLHQQTAVIHVHVY